MKFASVRELKNNASDLLRRAGQGERILITSHGKPVATLLGLSEENLEDFILAGFPEFRSGIVGAYEEYEKKGGTPVEKVISGLKKKHGKNPR